MGRQQDNDFVVAARRAGALVAAVNTRFCRSSPPAHLPASLHSRPHWRSPICCRKAGQQLIAAFQPVVPFLVTSAASMGAYAAGLAAAQVRCGGTRCQGGLLSVLLVSSASMPRGTFGHTMQRQLVSSWPQRAQAILVGLGRVVLGMLPANVAAVIVGHHSSFGHARLPCAPQAAGMALRVSCATPVAGPVGGLLGVGLASAAAGQAALKCRAFFEDSK